jgi:hypothetical protein
MSGVHPKHGGHDHAREQAHAQLESIKELVAGLKRAETADGGEAAEDARRMIHEDALSVEVRSAWRTMDQPFEAEEYRIVLCTGGPHVEIRGSLDQHNEPETARLLYQNCFEDLRAYPTGDACEQTLLTYARQFYYGEE